MKNSSSPPARIQSFGYAFQGILVILKSQPNARIHAVATVIVCMAGFVFGFTRAEWCWIILAIGSVWTAEAFNTAFEFFADAASPEYHPLVKKGKDAAAGAVLVSAIGSALIGVIIMLPYVVRIFSSAGR
jgi:diacylglycerol kinase (ATP)